MKLTEKLQSRRKLVAVVATANGGQSLLAILAKTSRLAGTARTMKRTITAINVAVTEFSSAPRLPGVRQTTSRSRLLRFLARIRQTLQKVRMARGTRVSTTQHATPYAYSIDW